MEKEKDGKKIINVDLEEVLDSEEPEEEEAANDSNLENNNSNVQPENGTTETNNKKAVKITRALKGILTGHNGKFMSNFDPELSNRERRKLIRKFNAEGRKSGTGSDENGMPNSAEKDACDCLIEDCPGCHFPCPKCRSCKCGVECRVNRKWMYECIKTETDVLVPKNSSNPAS